MPGFCSAFVTGIYLKDDDQRDSSLHRDNLPKEHGSWKEVQRLLNHISKDVSNSPLDELIYCKFPEGFEDLRRMKIAYNS
jgi:hypothetical protein